MLHARLPLNPGETTSSFWSRLAHQCGCADAKDLSRDVGVTFASVIAGVTSTLERMAELTGVAVSDFEAGAVLNHEGRYLLRGHQVSQRMLRRDRLMVCPACIVSDMAHDEDLGDAAPYARTSWLMAPIRVCSVHGLELVEAYTSSEFANLSFEARHDFTRLVAPKLHLLTGSSTAFRLGIVDPFEAYVRHRFEGKTSSDDCWLDSFPLHAAVRACEVVGAVERHGISVNLETLDEAQWREAASAGHSILAPGQQGFRSFLEGLLPDSRKHKGKLGLSLALGRLYRWMCFSKGTEFEELRTVATDLLTDRFALGPDDELFGRPIEKRRLHSIRSASQAADMHPSRMRKILRNTGFISEDDDDASIDGAVFPATEQADAFFAQLRTSLTFSEAMNLLNATRKQLEQFVEARLLVPLVQNNEDHNPYVFVREEVVNLERHLTSAAHETEAPVAHLVNIQTAARKEGVQNIVVAQLVLRGALTDVFRQAGKTGYQAILVNPLEVASILSPTPNSDPALPIHEVERQTGWSRRVVMGLILLEKIPSKFDQTDRGGNRRYRIMQSDLDAFRGRYSHQTEVAANLNMNWQMARAKLAKSGLKPAFDPMDTAATFYCHEDIAGWGGGA